MVTDVPACSEPPTPDAATPRRPIRSSEHLTIDQHTDERIVTLHLSGVVDSITTPHLATRLDIALTAGADLLIVDLTDVEFLASAGINLLIEVQRLTEGFATEMRVVADGAGTRRPLRILGVDTQLRLYPTVAEARSPAAGGA